jgi:glucose dehydrogenase
VDAERGIVYMPFGAPSVDQYGGDSAGDNLFSTSLVAADANTGKYLWHFQVVHHDIWDGDMTGAPALIDVKQGGRTIPAVVAMSKAALLFTARSRHRKTDLWRGGASGAAKRGAPGTDFENSTVPAEATPAGADDHEHAEGSEP